MLPKKEYIAEIERRRKDNRVSQKFQLIGLSLAEILEDQKHKALYIKLAKTHDETFLMGIAKTIAENKQIKNRGAYFMRVLKEKK